VALNGDKENHGIAFRPGDFFGNCQNKSIAEQWRESSSSSSSNRKQKWSGGLRPLHGDKEIDRHTHTPTNTEPLEAFYNWPRNLLFIIVAHEDGRHMFQVAKWLSAYLFCIELGFIAHSRHLAT
jgi:hypothetical protein